MKIITVLLLASLCTLTGVAQNKINWLTTSEFEKVIKQEKQNYFIFIEQDRVNENMPKERAEEMQKRIALRITIDGVNLEQGGEYYLIRQYKGENEEFKGKNVI